MRPSRSALKAFFRGHSKCLRWDASKCVPFLFQALRTHGDSHQTGLIRTRANGYIISVHPPSLRFGAAGQRPPAVLALVIFLPHEPAARQKTCNQSLDAGASKVRHPFGRADLDQRQAGSVRRRCAMAQQAVLLRRFIFPSWFAPGGKLSCRRMSREELPTRILKSPASETQPAFAGS